MDGGFVTKKLSKQLSRFPSAADIDVECTRITGHSSLSNLTLLRVYFYDAKPATGNLTNPIDGTKTNLGATQIHAQSTSFHQALEMQSDFALRMGEATVHDGRSARKRCAR